MGMTAKGRSTAPESCLPSWFRAACEMTPVARANPVTAVIQTRLNRRLALP
jgi:hypothetical protein